MDGLSPLPVDGKPAGGGMRPADLAFAFMLGMASNIAANLVYEAVSGEAKKNGGSFPVNAAVLTGAGMVLGALLLFECTRERPEGQILPKAPWG